MDQYRTTRLRSVTTLKLATNLTCSLFSQKLCFLFLYQQTLISCPRRFVFSEVTWFLGEKQRKFPAPNLTVKRSFTARNTGALSISVHGFDISGLACEGYGFRVLNCEPFKLPPNATRKVQTISGVACSAQD